MLRDEYNKLVDEFADTLYRYIVKMTADCELSKDITQDCWLKLWEISNNVDIANAKGFLFQTAYHIVVDNSRRNAVKQKYLEQITQQNVTIQTNEDRELIDYYLDKLPKDYKTCLLLRDEQGYSYEEISQITEMTLEKVKVTIYRARVKMKQFLMKGK